MKENCKSRALFFEVLAKRRISLTKACEAHGLKADTITVSFYRGTPSMMIMVLFREMGVKIEIMKQMAALIFEDRNKDKKLSKMNLIREIAFCRGFHLGDFFENPRGSLTSLFAFQKKMMELSDMCDTIGIPLSKLELEVYKNIQRELGAKKCWGCLNPI